jgi:hypothetical protein
LTTSCVSNLILQEQQQQLGLVAEAILQMLLAAAFVIMHRKGSCGVLTTGTGLLEGNQADPVGPDQ